MWCCGVAIMVVSFRCTESGGTLAGIVRQAGLLPDEAIAALR